MRRTARKIWVIVVCRVLMAAGYSISFPYFAVYLHKIRGVPMGWIGTFLFGSMLATVFPQAVGGSLADRRGRKATMLASLAGRGLLILGLAAAIASRASIWALAAMHVAAGLAGAFFDPAARAWIADRFEEHERADAYGVTRMAGNFGWALGPAIGGVLAGTDYALLFFLSSAAFAVSAALVWLRVREHEGWTPAAPSWRRELDALGDPRLRRLCAGVLAINVVMSHIIAPLSLHATADLGLSEAQVGVLFSLNGALVVALQWPLLRLFKRSRLTALLSLGCLAYAAGYASVAFCAGLGSLSLAMVVITLGENAVSPTMNAVAANLAGARERGRFLGAMGMAQQLGWALGPLAGGWGLQRWGGLRPGPYWFAVGAAAAVSAAVFAGLGAKLTEREDGLPLAGPTAAAQPAV